MYCEYSTGSRIDRKNQPVSEAERVADWILILLRCLMAMSDRAARILATGWTVAAGVAVAGWRTARWGLRRFECGSLAREWPHLCNSGWMTYCLGQGWTSAPSGLLPALARWVAGRLSPAAHGNVPGFVLCGAQGFVPNDDFLSCSERVRGFTAPDCCALGQSADFSMFACAADF